MNYLLFALGCAAFATVLMLAAQARRSLAASKWPQYPGDVVDSEFRVATGRLGPQYSVRVAYRYSVGESQVGTTILPSFMGTLRRQYARKLARHFHEGARIVVYVEPSNSQRSIILPGVERREWFMLGMMVLVTIGAFVGAFAL